MDLQVHHINYDRIGHENVESDLITLCKYCHKEIEEMKDAYTSLMNYRQAGQRRLELHFCESYQQKDYSGGGSLNMCNINVIREEWEKWVEQFGLFHLKGKIRVTTVIEYFRTKRIQMIIAMEDAGASPDEIRAHGISYNMVKKYYGNREFAERMIELFNKEIEGV